ncbi:MAG: glycosyltransferase [Bacteroidales bacterium]|nr:glycosyltransferase [Bacteroidales bacterium]
MGNSTQDLISVIVPVYNVENYLEKCLNSIVEQSYSNLDIILINDGSTDNSAKICEEFASHDSRIRLINQENQGLSGARNTGIGLIRGKYVTFVDSDDWIDYNYVETLYNLIVEHDADVSVVSFIYEEQVKTTNGVIEKTRVKYNDGRVFVFDTHSALRELCRDKVLQNLAWGKIYKSSLWLDNNILYPIGKLYEDVYTAFEIFVRVSKVVVYNVTRYHYRVRVGSIVNSKTWISLYDYVTAKRLQAEQCVKCGAFTQMPKFYLRYALHFINQYNLMPHIDSTNDMIMNIRESMRLYDGQGIKSMGLVYYIYRWLILKNINLYLRLSRYNDILFRGKHPLPFQPIDMTKYSK